MELSIRQGVEADSELLSDIMRRSFAEVAREFGLTPQNCPKHPSNCMPDWVRVDLSRGLRYFIAERDGEPAGCVAIEEASPSLWYLEHLAVLPEHRDQGIGRALVAHVRSQAREGGAGTVGISIIAARTGLKQWYAKSGFVEKETKTFPHLPFEVCFMEMRIDGAAGG